MGHSARQDPTGDSESQVFRVIQELLFKAAGITLPAERQRIVLTKVRRRSEELGYPQIASYVKKLKEPAFYRKEAEFFINTLTINKTEWFREVEQFQVLASHIAENHPPERAINIWCAACSYGHEVYSLLVYLKVALPRHQVQVFGSDIDSEVLKVAKNGVYPKAQIAHLVPHFKQFFVMGSNKLSDWVKLKKQIMSNVSFAKINLNDPSSYPVAQFDYVFCRNVFIYFQPPVIQSIVGHFASRTSRNALLFIGLSETLNRINTEWQLIAKSVYAKSGKGPIQAKKGSVTQIKPTPLYNTPGRTSASHQSLSSTKLVSSLNNKVILIGSSTGGLEALRNFFLTLQNFQMPPILIAQHIRPGFIQNVVKSFNKQFRFTFKLASHNEALQINHVYFASDGHHLEVTEENQVVLVSLKKPQRSDMHVPSVNRLFLSAASSLTKTRGFACIFTGMGKDGAIGLKSLKTRGFQFFCQDPGLSFVDGMPSAALQSTKADYTGSTKGMAKRLAESLEKVPWKK